MTVHTEAKRTVPPTDDITVVPDAGDRSTKRSLHDPAYQGFLLLWVGFTVAPLLFGVDKFFDRMTDWSHYLAPSFASRSPFDVHTTMLVIGAVEIVAGLLVLVRPRIGGYVVAGWLAGIIVNLLALGGYADVALRDFGLLLGALALARLATTYRPAVLRPAPSR